MQLFFWIPNSAFEFGAVMFVSGVVVAWLLDALVNRATAVLDLVLAK